MTITYHLREWISIDKLDWDHLSFNPNAMELLKANPRPTRIRFIGAGSLVTQHKNNWGMLSYNPSAMDLLMDNPDNIDWMSLSENPSAAAIELSTDNQFLIHWAELSTHFDLDEYLA